MATSISTTSSSPNPNVEMSFHEFYTIYHIDCSDNWEQTGQRIIDFFTLQDTGANTHFVQQKITNLIIKGKTKYDDWKKWRTVEKYKVKFSSPAITKNEFPDKKQKPPKRPTKDFTDVGPRQKRRKLTDLNSELDDFAHDNNMDVNQVIGYLLYQRNYNTNKYLAKIGDDLYNKRDVEETTRVKLDVDHALALKSHVNLSRNDLDFVKSFQKEYVHIPNRNDIRVYAQSLLPKVKECREKRGIVVENLQDTVTLTISRLIDHLEKMNIDLPTNLTYKQKTGHDGAGGQSVYRANDNPMTDPNIFAKMYVPLSLIDTDTQETVWKNETPNSAFYTRPLALIAEKESPDLIKFINETFEPEEKKLRDKGIELEHGTKKYKVSLIIEDSMKDLKVRTVESGLGGAECLMCETQQADWKNKDKINDGNAFEITRTADRTAELYKEMIGESGKIKKKKNDYETRTGLTTEPLSSSDHHYLTLTHQYINGTTWFLNILYRIKAELFTWAVRGVDNQEKLKKAKNFVLTSIEEKTGLKLDQIDSSSGHTGTSTTGQQGRRFFSYEYREKILESVPDKFKQNYSHLMQMYSVILRAVSSTQSLNIEELKKVTVDFSLFIANEFSWVDYNITVHNLIFHSAQLVERNNGIALGELSEEALESSNKDVRNYREFLSRKCGHIPNLTDVFNRLFIRSDPIIRSIITRSQSRREKRATNTNALAAPNEDEILLSKILV